MNTLTQVIKDTKVAKKLSGSAKQKKWAKEIRESILKYEDQTIADYKKMIDKTKNNNKLTADEQTQSYYVNKQEVERARDIRDLKISLLALIKVKQCDDAKVFIDMFCKTQKAYREDNVELWTLINMMSLLERELFKEENSDEVQKLIQLEI